MSGSSKLCEAHTLPRCVRFSQPRLLKLSVRPSFRGGGLATELLSDACRFARSRGMKHLTLTCDTLNVASRRVIEKNGGVLVDTYPEEGRMTQRFHVAL